MTKIGFLDKNVAEIITSSKIIIFPTKIDTSEVFVNVDQHDGIHFFVLHS